MIATLLCAAAVSALAAIAAEWRGQERRHRSFYLLKPLTGLLILAVAATVSPQTPEPYRLWVCAALVFCIAGDIALMFSGDRFFLGGLGSFLIAHLLFVGAFTQGLGTITIPLWALPWALLVSAAAVSLLPRTGSLKPAVAVYMGVIGAMALVAAARFDALGDARSLRALSGASVFMLSDGLLGLRQFVGPYRQAQPLILSTYWLAIGLIACSV